MMQPCQDGNGDNGAGPLDGSTQRRIFLQCQVRARLIVIRRIGGKNSPQVRLAEDDHLVQALAAQACRSGVPHSHFATAILARSAGRGYPSPSLGT